MSGALLTLVLVAIFYGGGMSEISLIMGEGVFGILFTLLLWYSSSPMIVALVVRIVGEGQRR